ncbi:ATP-binding cassette domain-containing protein, partial [Streptomyces sp. SID685]
MGEAISTSEILSATGVDLSYGNNLAVRNAHLSIARGEIAAVTGQSGSGKSSLLYCLAGVLPTARGQVRFQGQALGDLDDEAMSALRRESFGFVFQ